MQAGLAPTLEAGKAKHREACALSTQVPAQELGKKSATHSQRQTPRPSWPDSTPWGLINISVLPKVPYGHNLTVA
jgi:hypothetical protein